MGEGTRQSWWAGAIRARENSLACLGVLAQARQVARQPPLLRPGQQVLRVGHHHAHQLRRATQGETACERQRERVRERVGALGWGPGLSARGRLGSRAPPPPPHPPTPQMTGKQAAPRRAACLRAQRVAVDKGLQHERRPHVHVLNLLGRNVLALQGFSKRVGGLCGGGGGGGRRACGNAAPRRHMRARCPHTHTHTHARTAHTHARAPARA